MNKLIALITLVLLAALVAMAACDTQSKNETVNNSVRLVTLDAYNIDCIVMSSGNRGGISCDWESYHDQLREKIEQELQSAETSCYYNPELCAPPEEQQVNVLGNTLPPYCLREYDLPRTPTERKNCTELYINAIKAQKE